jgi:hypothetical protein
MANAPAITFRPARPEDAPEAVPLILSSGPDAFDFVFKSSRNTPAGFLLRAFPDAAGQFGYRNHVVGEVDGRVVAAGAGWTSASALPFLTAAVRQFLASARPAHGGRHQAAVTGRVLYRSPWRRSGLPRPGHRGRPGSPFAGPGKGLRHAARRARCGPEQSACRSPI